MTERFDLQRTFRFEAAHHLPVVPEHHRCRKMHGHSYEIEIHVEGPLDPHLGWIIDFAEIDEAFEPVHQQLDHQLLNDLPGLENPTSEMLGRWIWRHLIASIPGLVAIVVRETPHSACTYRG
jgi:6-pyruvoyltetrahydropterin/6-carboxytetrahydropterin synthase